MTRKRRSAAATRCRERMTRAPPPRPANAQPRQQRVTDAGQGVVVGRAMATSGLRSRGCGPRKPYHNHARPSTLQSSVRRTNLRRPTRRTAPGLTATSAFGSVTFSLSRVTAPCSTRRRASRVPPASPASVISFPIQIRPSSFSSERADLDLRDLLGEFVLAEDPLELRLRLPPRPLRRGRAGRSRAASVFLATIGCPASSDLDLVHRDLGGQLEVGGHQVVGDRHQLAEDLVRRLADAHVVAQRLAHLLDAIQPHEQRREEGDLRLLTVLSLEMRGPSGC